MPRARADHRISESGGGITLQAVARFIGSGFSRVKTDALIDEWKNACLLESGSLIFPDRSVWTIENLQDFRERLIENPLQGADQSFGQKLALQLETADEEIRWLVVELVAIYLLFVREAIGTPAKRAMLKSIVAPLGEELPPGWRKISEAMSEGIGNPGPGYNLTRDRQIGYLIDFCLRFKAIGEPHEQQQLLTDPWRMRDFADAASAGIAVREMRHILLHLLFPDEFERISSRTHKRVIVDAFANEFLTGDAVSDDVDERLYEIRQRLAATGAQPSGGDSMFDFYRPPLQSIWDPGSTQSEGASDIDLLAYKKQLVVFGAPGTGKTHRTRQLAEQIIRRAALEKWGAARFFTEQAALDGYIAANVHWLQLHPGYGYEEFIRGLRLTPDGSTTYVPGYLPLLVKAINAVPAKDRLPVVLVLDEINRTDLSRMFGEAFSLLENRDSVAILPGVNSDNGDDQVATLALPSNLFVIGTMNLIDQSVEELDFALRRRFFWRPAEFDASAIIAVNANRWRKHSPTKWGWDRAVDDMTLLAERAGLLNQAISASPHLGSQYELGHTYYFDASFFVGNWLRGRKTLSGGGVLWATNGKPRPGLNDLWTYSLEPLLMQYLGGLEADVAASERARLKAVLFSGTLP